MDHLAFLDEALLDYALCCEDYPNAVDTPAERIQWHQDGIERDEDLSVGERQDALLALKVARLIGDEKTVLAEEVRQDVFRQDHSVRPMVYLDAIDTIFYALLARNVDGRYDWSSSSPAEDLPEWIRLARQDGSIPEEEKRELELIAKVARLIDVSNQSLVDEVLEEIISIRTTLDD